MDRSPPPPCSAPTRLGKGQGVQEIGHNLARERPKFGHILVRKRQKIGHSLERERPFTRERPKFKHTPTREGHKIWAQFCGRSMKTCAQICKHCTVHQLSENTKIKMLCKKKISSSRVLCKSGRAQGSLGRAQDSKGRAQHPQKYASLEHCPQLQPAYVPLQLMNNKSF